MNRPSAAKLGALTWVESFVIKVAGPPVTGTIQTCPPPGPVRATNAMCLPPGSQTGSLTIAAGLPVIESSRVVAESGSSNMMALRGEAPALVTMRTKAIMRPSCDHAASPSYPSGSDNWVNWRGPLESMFSNHRPVRPFRSPRNTTRRPSGENEGSRSSAVSRTASVIGRAAPPRAGISHSWPSRSNTIHRPSRERSKARCVPSRTLIVIVSKVCL